MTLDRMPFKKANALYTPMLTTRQNNPDAHNPAELYDSNAQANCRQLSGNKQQVKYIVFSPTARVVSVL
jgi:hypothetical protein